MPSNSSSVKQRLGTTLILLTVSMAASGQKYIASGKEESAKTELPISLPSPPPSQLSEKSLDLYRHDPNNEIAFFTAGNYLLRTTKFAETEKLCKEASKNHPKWASPYFVLAKLSENSLDDEQAITYYQRAVQCNPNWLYATHECASKLMTCERPKDAVTVADAGLKVCDAHPKSIATAIFRSKLRRCKAQSLYNLRDFVAAASEIEKDPPVYREEPIEKLLASSYRESKQWTKCLAVTNRFLKSHENDQDFRLLRAQAYAGTGQWQKAVDDLTINLTLHSHQKNKGLSTTEVFYMREVRILRAQMYEKLGRKDLAEMDRTEVKNQMKESYKELPFRTGR